MGYLTLIMRFIVNIKKLDYSRFMPTGLIESSPSKAAMALPQVDSKPPFEPKIVDRLPAENTTLWYGSRPVYRELLGRRIVGIIDENGEELKVIYQIFLRAQGGMQDHPLFLVAHPHMGWTGVEGVVTRVTPITQAQKITFTSSIL